MALTQGQVSQLYVSLLGRASEGDGSTYWMGTGTTMAETADRMLASPDAQTYFGTSLDTNQAFVEHIYTNTMGKDPATDTAGVTYWVDRLEAGEGRGTIVADMVYALVNGDFTGDAAAIAAQNQFNNRVTVSNYVADNIATADVADLSAFQGYINTVTDDTTTVDASKADVDIAAANPIASYTLTADTASVTEGGNVTFTVTALDADGNPTLATTAATLNYQIVGVEVAGGTADPATDLGNVTGEVTLSVGSSTATFTLTPSDDGVTEGFEGFKVSLLDGTFTTLAESANVVIKDGAEAGQTFTLTTSTDAITGTDGNDTISGVLQAAGATGTTVAPGDSVDGGDGTDTMTVSVAGDAGKAYTLSAITTKNVENRYLSNFDTDGTADGTVVATGLMTGLSEVGLSASGANGDTVFNGMQTFVDAKMANGSGDLKLTYDGAQVVTGTTDSQKLTVSNLTGGTFTADGIETINVTTELAASKMAGVASNALKTLNVTGDQDLTVSGALSFAATTNGATIDGTIDASAFTGKLSVDASGSASTVSVTGGTGDDTIAMAGTLTKNDVIDGGDGTDTLSLNSAALTTEFTNVKNIEKVAFNSAASVAMDVSKLSAGVTTVEVDLKDTTDNATVDASTITNLSGQAVVVKHATADTSAAGDADGVNLQITNATDTPDDSISVTLDAIDTTANKKGIDTLNLGNYETINLVSAKDKLATVVENEVKTVTASSATAINLSGDVTTTTIGSITTKGTKSAVAVDASGLAGKLTATFSSDDKITATAAQSDTTFNFGTTLNNDDTIVGGASAKDKVTGTVSNATATTGALNISGVETVELTTGAANTLNLAGVTGATTVAVTDNKQTITGLDLTTAIQLGLTGDESATSSEIDVTAADATGADDTLKVVLENTNGATNSIIDASNIENLALTVNAAGNGGTLDLTTFEGTAITVDSKSGVTATAALALGTLYKTTTTLTSTYADKLTASFANATSAITFTGAGTDVQNITGSTKGDTFTIGSTGAVAHVIAGGTGTDTLGITVKNGFADPSNLAVENLNISVNAGDDVTTTAAFHADVDNITFTGGNSLSTFTTAAGAIGDGVKVVDASAFGGNVVLDVTKNLVDSTVTFTGGALTTDEIQYQIDATGTDALTSTGIEILDLNIDETSTLDLGSATGVTTIDVDVAASKTFTIDKLTGSENILVTAGAASSTIEAKLADATGATDAIAFELKDAAANIATGLDLKTTDIETVTIKASSAESVDLSNFSMATAGKYMSLTVTGDKALTVSALNADVTTIDASGMTTGGSFVQTGRSSATASTYTGSEGDDTFIMMHKDDAIAAGNGSDTLDINFAAVIGGMEVDLSATGDQVGTFNGSANAAVQSGFVNVDLSGYTGFGAQITAAATGSTIVGTASADQITGGAKADTITATNGNDVITAGGGQDTINLGAGTETVVLSTTEANADVVEGFTSTTDDIKVTTSLLNAADATITDAGDISGSATIDAAIGVKADATQYVFSNAAFDLDLTAVTDGAFTAAEMTAVTTAAAAALNATTKTNLDATFLASETVLFVLDDTSDTSSAIFAFNNSTATGNAIDAGELVLLGVVDANAILATGDIIL